MAKTPFKSKDGFSIDGKTDIIRGSVDPRTAGVVAPLTSLYFREDAAIVELYQKTGAASTAWVKVGAGASDEDGFQNAFTGKPGMGSASTAFSSKTVVADGDTLLVACGKLDAAIGAPVAPIPRANHPLVAGASDRRNMEALDAAIGMTPTSANYIAGGDPVNANLSALDTKLKQQADAVSALQTGQKWITKMAFITADNLTARSGLAAFSDDRAPITLPVAGDRVVSTFDNKIYVASAGAWAAGEALSQSDTFFVDNNLIDTSADREKTATYTFDGTACILAGTFDFEAADSISLATGYSAGAGNPVGGDTIQQAIAKVDGNADALAAALGIAQAATNLGTWAGAGATRLLVSTETAKTAIQKLANEIGAAAGGVGDFALSANTVNANINAIDQELTRQAKRVVVSTITSETTTTIDVVDMSGANRVVEWDVYLTSATDPTKVYSSKVRLIATATGNDYTEYAILVLGQAFSNVELSVDSTALGAVSLKVTATCAGGFASRVVRRTATVA